MTRAAETPLAKASAALAAAGWDTSSEDDEGIYLAVADNNERQGARNLAEIRAIVGPLGCDAEWTGSSNTDARGETSSDVLVTESS